MSIGRDLRRRRKGNENWTLETYSKRNTLVYRNPHCVFCPYYDDADKSNLFMGCKLSPTGVEPLLRFICPSIFFEGDSLGNKTFVFWQDKKWRISNEGNSLEWGWRMATGLDPKQMLSSNELLTSQVVSQEAIIRLLLEKGIFSREEFWGMLKVVDREMGIEKTEIL